MRVCVCVVKYLSFMLMSLSLVCNLLNSHNDLTHLRTLIHVCTVEVRVLLCVRKKGD